MCNFKLKDLSLGYQKKVIINPLSLSLNKNDTVGIIGKNGSGKSTLIKSFFNKSLILEGQVLLDNINLNNLKDFSRIFSYVPQELVYPDYLTTKELLTLNNSDKKNSPSGFLEKFNAKDLLNRELRSLSGGEKRKIAICSAIYKNPKILLLDEPETHLDPREETNILNFLKNRKHTQDSITFIISHSSKILENLCNKYLVIKDKNVNYHESFKSFNLEDCYE